MARGATRDEMEMRVRRIEMETKMLQNYTRLFPGRREGMFPSETDRSRISDFH